MPIRLTRDFVDVTSVQLDTLTLPARTAPARTRRRRSQPQASGQSTRVEQARRALNVVVAIVGLIIAAPLMAVIAVLVRATSDGPILYRQTRVGMDRRWGTRDLTHSRRRHDLGGRPFTIYKFRTMAHSPSGDAAVWASPDDPRVTVVGRVLRKLRLDELPQLWNVLRDDMNIVGPRPEQPRIFVQLREQIDEYGVRQRVRPGITGWAQINQHYDRTIDDVRRTVAFDLEYIARRSVLEDLKIMALTVPVIVFRRGAW
jgi:lipopolysaccharide/colanic/teichoic acid biosynthesis glycosyltransferase